MNSKSIVISIIIFCFIITITLLFVIFSFPYCDLISSINHKESFNTQIPYYGFKYSVNNPVIVDILPNSPADKAGLKVGDEIVQINQKPITVQNQIQTSIFDNSNSLTIDINRNNSKISFTLNKDIGITHSYGLHESYIYADSLKINRNYAIGWFKTMKNSPIATVCFKDPDKFGFSYTKDLYVCDCKNGKIALAYIGIYDNNDKLLNVSNFIFSKKFHLENPDNGKLLYHYALLCNGHESRTGKPYYKTYKNKL